jgi:drug/metabolite transporter (DMT)-like permease
VSRDFIRFAALCVIWGSTWIALKASVTAVQPLLLAGLRFAAAGFLMLLLLMARRTQIRLPVSRWSRLFVVSVLMVAAPYGLLFWGARFLPSGLTSILDLASLPIALLCVGAALGAERLDAARAGGVAVGVLGIVILFGPAALAIDQHGDPRAMLLGAGAIILSAICYSFGSVLARPLLGRMSSSELSMATMLAGGLLLLLVALLVEPGTAAALGFRWGAAALGGWLFLVVFGSVIGTTIFLDLLRSWGPARAGSYAFVSPIIAVLLGVAVLGEHVGPRDALGMVIMLGGAWLTLRKRAVR